MLPRFQMPRASKQCHPTFMLVSPTKKRAAPPDNHREGITGSWPWRNDQPQASCCHSLRKQTGASQATNFIARRADNGLYCLQHDLVALTSERHEHSSRRRSPNHRESGNRETEPILSGTVSNITYNLQTYTDIWVPRGGKCSSLRT